MHGDISTELSRGHYHWRTTEANRCIIRSYSLNCEISQSLGGPALDHGRRATRCPIESRVRPLGLGPNRHGRILRHGVAAPPPSDPAKRSRSARARTPRRGRRPPRLRPHLRVRAEGGSAAGGTLVEKITPAARRAPPLRAIRTEPRDPEVVTRGEVVCSQACGVSVVESDAQDAHLESEAQRPSPAGSRAAPSSPGDGRASCSFWTKSPRSRPSLTTA